MNWRRRWRRRRTCWPFEWPCWMKREGEWRSSRGNNGCHSPLPICGWRTRSSLIQMSTFLYSPSRHSSLFSVIQSPFHFPIRGRHARPPRPTSSQQATILSYSWQPTHSTPFSAAGMFTKYARIIDMFRSCSVLGITSNTPIV
jgi:hypothetical protein